MLELEKILNELEKQIFSAEVYNDDFDGTYIGNLICLGNVREVLEDYFNDGWISVEERLPEDGTYLCTLAGELCGIEEPFTGMCGIENGIWDEPDCVIAWRPLPEPYRPERSGE